MPRYILKPVTSHPYFTLSHIWMVGLRLVHLVLCLMLTTHPPSPLPPGDAVLDLGSGLGVDALIAAAAAGAGGSVVGLEISRSEVAAAEALRAAQKVRSLHRDWV